MVAILASPVQGEVPFCKNGGRVVTIFLLVRANPSVSLCSTAPLTQGSLILRCFVDVELLIQDCFN